MSKHDENVVFSWYSFAYNILDAEYISFQNPSNIKNYSVFIHFHSMKSSLCSKLMSWMIHHSVSSMKMNTHCIKKANSIPGSVFWLNAPNRVVSNYSITSNTKWKFAFRNHIPKLAKIDWRWNQRNPIFHSVDYGFRKGYIGIASFGSILALFV